MPEATPAENPTVQASPLTLSGKEVHLVYDFAALATAESVLRKQGVQANLLHSLDLADVDASGLAAILFAGMLRENPALTYAETLTMITFDNLGDIFDAVLAAYVAAQKPADEGTSPNAQGTE
jgi:hypothetical protein